MLVVRAMVEAEFGDGDDELDEERADGPGDPFQIAANNVAGIFRGVTHDRDGLGAREVPKAGDTGGNCDGRIEGEEGLGAPGSGPMMPTVCLPPHGLFEH